MSEIKSIFEKHYGKMAGEFSPDEKELRKSEIKRDLENAYSQAYDKTLEIKRKILHSYRDDFANYQIASDIECDFEIEGYENTMKAIEKKHVDLFGEAIRTKR